METLMKPFIFIYHVVSSILNFPSKILNGKVEEGIETVRMNINKKNDSAEDTKDSDNKETETSNYENLKQKIPKRQPKPLIAYRYTILDSNKKKITGIFEAESESDIRGFLTSQGYEVLKVEVKKPYDIEIGGNGPIKAGALSFSLTQMSTYIKAGIPLVDAVRILAKQSRKQNEKRAYERLVYDLLKGENLSDAMLKQDKKFPKLLINMIKTAEMTGDLPSILDDMADYYTSIDQPRRQMISAMTYPAVVIIMAICVLIFMLIYLVPQFVQLYEDQDATLPAITLFIMGASNFLKSYYLWLILATVIFILLFYYLYNNVKSFKTAVQTVLM